MLARKFPFRINDVSGTKMSAFDALAEQAVNSLVCRYRGFCS